MTSLLLLALLLLPSSLSFSPAPPPCRSSLAPPPSPLPLGFAPRPSTSLPGLFGISDEEEELRKAVKGDRFAAAGDRVVELKRPLGIVLDQDERGNVYVDQ
ncbi:hypothetical protein TeGR_g10404, partial [Tetraparma gracilis]